MGHQGAQGLGHHAGTSVQCIEVHGDKSMWCMGYASVRVHEEQAVWCWGAQSWAMQKMGCTGTSACGVTSVNRD